MKLLVVDLKWGITMSNFVWCHGPNCHTSHTQDRIRGVKGSKVLRTRKVKQYTQEDRMYNYFCSQGCYNDFANTHVREIIALHPRTEALETPIENPTRYTNEHTGWGHMEIKKRVDHNGG